MPLDDAAQADYTKALDSYDGAKQSFRRRAPTPTSSASPRSWRRPLRGCLRQGPGQGRAVPEHRAPAPSIPRTAARRKRLLGTARRRAP